MSVVKFSEVAHRANTKEDRFNTEKNYYVGGEHIEPGELFIHNKGFIKGSTIGPMFYCGFKSGQILFVTRNPHLRKCSVAEFDGICSEKTFVIETIDERILLQEYLASVMLSDDFWNYCEENKSGGVNYFLNWSTLADYEFELPSVEEQKVISDKVWAAYRLKESYKKLLAATEEMVKSQFIEMFGDPLKNPKNYTQRKLGDVATLLNGRAYKASELLSSGRYLVLRVGNFFTNTDYYYSDLELEPDKYCDTGDILYSWSATLGAQIWKGGKVIYHYHIWKVLFDENILNKEYFCFMLNVMTDSLKQETHGSTMVHLTKDGMEKKFIAIPPLELQRRFVSIAEQADKSGFELRKSIEAIDAVIKSLVNS